jgi:hypothetical protein
VYVRDTIAKCLEQGVQQAEGGVPLHEVQHKVDAGKCVSATLLHSGQMACKGALLSYSENNSMDEQFQHEEKAGVYCKITNGVYLCPKTRAVSLFLNTYSTVLYWQMPGKNRSQE